MLNLKILNNVEYFLIWGNISSVGITVTGAIKSILLAFVTLG